MMSIEFVYYKLHSNKQIFLEMHALKIKIRDIIFSLCNVTRYNFV